MNFKQSAGTVLIVAGLGLGLIDWPMMKHVMDDPRSATPDVRRGLVVQNNCHGTACFITKANAERGRELAFMAPATIVTVFVGLWLAGKWDDDD